MNDSEYIFVDRNVWHSFRDQYFKNNAINPFKMCLTNDRWKKVADSLMEELQLEPQPYNPSDLKTYFVFKIKDKRAFMLAKLKYGFSF